MRIPTKNLPSHGLYTGDPILEINPLKYSELVAYDKYPTGTLVQKYSRDIDLLITRIPRWESYLLYDLDSILFTIKYVSVTKDSSAIVSVTCPDGHEFKTNLKITDLNFRDLDNDILKYKAINMHGTKFPINFNTTIETFREVLAQVERYGQDLPRNELFLMALLYNGTNLNDVYRLITEAKNQEIGVLYYISDLVCKNIDDLKFKCQTCGKEVVIRCSNLITDIFRTILLNTKLDSSYLEIE